MNLSDVLLELHASQTSSQYLIHTHSSSINSLFPNAHGGVEPGTVIEISGSPGTGKTAIAADLTSDTLRSGRRAVWLSTRGDASLPIHRLNVESREWRLLSRMNIQGLSQLMLLFANPEVPVIPERTGIIVIDDMQELIGNVGVDNKRGTGDGAGAKDLMVRKSKVIKVVMENIKKAAQKRGLTVLIMDRLTNVWSFVKRRQELMPVLGQCQVLDAQIMLYRTVEGVLRAGLIKVGEGYDPMACEIQRCVDFAVSKDRVTDIIPQGSQPTSSTVTPFTFASEAPEALGRPTKRKFIEDSTVIEVPSSSKRQASVRQIAGTEEEEGDGEYEYEHNTQHENLDLVDLGDRCNRAGVAGGAGTGTDTDTDTDTDVDVDVDVDVEAAGATITGIDTYSGMMGQSGVGKTADFIDGNRDNVRVAVSVSAGRQPTLGFTRAGAVLSEILQEQKQSKVNSGDFDNNDRNNVAVMEVEHSQTNQSSEYDKEKCTSQQILSRDVSEQKPITVSGVKLISNEYEGDYNTMEVIGRQRAHNSAEKPIGISVSDSETVPAVSVGGGSEISDSEPELTPIKPPPLVPCAASEPLVRNVEEDDNDSGSPDNENND